MSKTTNPNAASTEAANTAPTVAPSVEALRALPDVADPLGIGRALVPQMADGLADAIAALGQPAPLFLQDAPKPGAVAAAPADDLFRTGDWPDADGVEATMRGLRALLASADALHLFAFADTVPSRYFCSPRLGFRAGLTAADVEAMRRAGTTRCAGAPAGHAQYECELTRRSFTLPPGAPVPVLLLDAPGDTARGPFDMPPPTGAAAREYGSRDFNEPSSLVVHPALVEAGPAHVLRAAWSAVEHRLWKVAEELVDVCDLASAFSGAEPDALAFEWPARAYRAWEPIEHAAKATTWRRSLAGVQPAR